LKGGEGDFKRERDGKSKGRSQRTEAKLNVKNMTPPLLSTDCRRSLGASLPIKKDQKREKKEKGELRDGRGGKTWKQIETILRWRCDKKQQEQLKEHIRSHLKSNTEIGLRLHACF